MCQRLTGVGKRRESRECLFALNEIQRSQSIINSHSPLPRCGPIGLATLEPQQDLISVTGDDAISLSLLQS